MTFLERLHVFHRNHCRCAGDLESCHLAQEAISARALADAADEVGAGSAEVSGEWPRRATTPSAAVISRGK